MTGGDPDEDLDCGKWNILYPNYINSKKTIPMGRRIGVGKAVPDPHPAEMAEICEFLKIPHHLEMDKAYPRDWFMNKGRIRVMLKTPEGNFTHPEIQSKRALMEKMGELIPKLKSRVSGVPRQAPVPGAPGTSSGAVASASSAAAPVSKAAKKEAKREEKKAQKKKGKYAADRPRRSRARAGASAPQGGVRARRVSRRSPRPPAGAPSLLRGALAPTGG
eukprot:CAMPEP_0176236682 /NCGR_PEP_ID=MMETSP0121_2-20121125/27465_1 /TAXON_ID=160619 /ORGANISM="Kryptoperidinium foliaceum, Strain CCMP 1326" /LENGTH=218 /DNA_ID=CAMNT_0017576113 /DNA_START=48 /DNA_END=701 /DNA_ORIENTATION=+